MVKQKIIRIASDPDMATEQINDAIANLGGYAYYLMPINPDTVLIEYDSEGDVSDSIKFKFLRIASDPDIATDQINEAIKAIEDANFHFIYGIYPDTVIIPYYEGGSNYRVKVVRIASDPDIATKQINEATEEIYKEHSKTIVSISVLYSDTLLVSYDYND
jgi:hypothetical protein